MDTERDPIEPVILGTWDSIGGKSPADVRRKIAREALSEELAKHPLIRSLFDEIGRETGLYAAALAVARSSDAVARTLGYADRIDQRTAELAANKELWSRPDDDDRPWPEVLLRGAKHDGPVLRRQMRAAGSAIIRRNELLRTHSEALAPESRTIIAAARLAADLLGVARVPGWLAPALSTKLKERFGVAKIVFEYPIEVTLARPAPRLVLATLPGETHEALDKRLKEARAELRRARPSRRSERAPRSKQASVARDAQWLYRHWVEQIPKDHLAQEYCENERRAGASHHGRADHWRSDRSLVYRGINQTQQHLGLVRRESKARN